MPRVSKSERRIEALEARIIEKEGKLKDARAWIRNVAITIGKEQVEKHQALVNQLTSNPNGWAAAMDASRDPSIGPNGMQGEPLKLLFNPEYIKHAQWAAGMNIPVTAEETQLMGEIKILKDMVDQVTPFMERDDIFTAQLDEIEGN
jgi:hypothetical protein